MPHYDKKMVMDRKLKVMRPTKRLMKKPPQPKWL